MPEGLQFFTRFNNKRDNIGNSLSQLKSTLKWATAMHFEDFVTDMLSV